MNSPEAHSFRPYSVSDRAACLAIFDANCPAYFAPNERDDYEAFLDANPATYEVCIVNDVVAGAFGLTGDDVQRKSLNWILIDPSLQGCGIGSAIMDRVVAIGRDSGWSFLDIAASHKSAPFFARFGAVIETVVEDGWGPGMTRVNMVLDL
jgi:GNAT superfamily N-acetyltransferase